MSNIIIFVFIYKDNMGNLKHPIINGEKQCGQCGKNKLLNCFSKHGNYYRSYCKECNKENVNKFRNIPANKEKIIGYAKKHYEKPGVKQKKYKATQSRILLIKEKAVEYKGGKCSVCGYNKCIHALEFHHTNPLEKDKALNSRGIDRRKSFEILKIELDKCILVCANCHREIHYKV